MKEFGPRGGGRASLAPPLRSANVMYNFYLKYTPLDLSLYNSNARLWKEGTLRVHSHRTLSDSVSDVKNL